MNEADTFKADRMWIGFSVMVLTGVWAIASYFIDSNIHSEFSWFSASGAIMVSGSILFERLKPGTGLDGGMDIATLPRFGQSVRHQDLRMMHYAGHFSISILLIGTFIWAYGSLII